MTDQIRAPWTPEQVAIFNRFQREGGMHPFTCGGDHAPGSPVLVARIDGWHCSDPYGEGCDYRQDWAHQFMAEPNTWPQTPASAPVPAQDTPGGPGRQPDAPEAPQPAPGGFPEVQGRCPACGGSSLFVGSGGYITCSRIECPEPDAATTLLERNPRTTPDNPATSSDAADNPLRELQEMYRQQSAANAAYRLQIDELIRRNSEYANRGISNGQRADQLAATLRQTLDAFEAYWSRASYCGPSETAVQPEHLQAWRAVLDGKEQP